jgi:hypothetical protein
MEFHLGQTAVSSVFLSHLDGQGQVLQINMKAEGKKVCCKVPAPFSIFLALCASLRAIPGMPKASHVLKVLAGEKGAWKLKLATKYGNPPKRPRFHATQGVTCNGYLLVFAQPPTKSSSTKAKH